MLTIRAEHLQDIAGIRLVTRTAFDSEVEADIVDSLRQQARPFVSLVAIDTAGVIGHIAFSPMTLDSHIEARIAALAPMAVLPARQRAGIGSALVRSGLDECRRLGFVAVVVLGHAEFYPRFGFLTGSTFGLSAEIDVPDEAFMALELQPRLTRSVSRSRSLSPCLRHGVDPVGRSTRSTAGAWPVTIAPLESSKGGPCGSHRRARPWWRAWP